MDYKFREYDDAIRAHQAVEILFKMSFVFGPMWIPCIVATEVENWYIALIVTPIFVFLFFYRRKTKKEVLDARMQLDDELAKPDPKRIWKE